MNYTKNYHLPQWEETDRVLRTDFNRMCADIESGLSQTASDAEAAVKKVESTATAGIKKAQQTADTAVSKADAARVVADAAYCPSFMPYATGTYSGVGDQKTVTINIGFNPSFLIISGQIVSQAAGAVSFFMAAGRNTPLNCVTFQDSGFTVQKTSDGVNPNINQAGRKYSYIAFR